MRRFLIALCLLLAGLTQAHATSTTQFMNMQAVNIHWTYDGTSYGTVNLPNAMAYIGFKHMRGENPLDANSTQLARLKAITDSGVKTSFTYFWQTPNLSDDIAAAESAVSYLGAGAVEAIEGQNECDGNPNDLGTYDYNGLTGFAGCVQFQKDLYAAVKADSNLSSVPYVYMFSQTFGSAQIPNTPDMSAWADVGNYHAYFSVFPGYVAIDNTMPGVEQIASTRPFILTESGWTDCAESGYPYYITRNASAPYSLSASLDAFQYNVHGSPLRLTKYELLDENQDDACTDHEQHFGMFDWQGNPKPIATAWHNLAGLFSDPNPTGAQISPTGTPSASGGVNSQVFTMSNAWVYALWTDATFMDISTHTDVTPSNVSSTVNLGATYASVVATDPVSGSTLGTWSNVSSVTVSFNGLAIIKVSNSTGATATSLSLAGPSAGNTGSPSSNFTITPNGTAGSSILITPSDSGGGGTFTPSSLTITSGSSAAVNFTYTPSSTGTKSISFTNSASLTETGTPISYTATAATATSLALSGSTSGVVGQATTFTATPNGNVGANTTITPSDNGGGGSFSPVSATIVAVTATTKTFAYTPASSGTKSISITNNQSLAETGTPISLSVSAAAATQLVLSGPTSGVQGVQSSNFTVTPNGMLGSTVVITPSDSGAGGTFSPSSITINAGSSTPATFKYTPASSGTKSISITNNASLTNSGTPISYVVASNVSLALTGPTSGAVSATSGNFVITPSAALVATTIITPSDGGNGGTFSPSSITINAGSSTATGFTYTPASAGTFPIQITNNQSLGITSSPIQFTATAGVSVAHNLYVLFGGDSYNGQPVVSFQLDGNAINASTGSTVLVNALRSLGQVQSIKIPANLASGVHRLTVFFNDGCTNPNVTCNYQATSRNLYLEAIFVDNAVKYSGYSAIVSGGSISIAFSVP